VTYRVGLIQIHGKDEQTENTIWRRLLHDYLNAVGNLFFFFLYLFVIFFWGGATMVNINIISSEV
jgi:hypothetical protein